MRTHKNPSMSPIKIVEKLGAVILPLIIVLMVSVAVRSLTREPIAQAKSGLTLPSDDTPISPDGAPNVYIVQDDQIPNSSFLSSGTNGVMLYAGNFRLVKPPFEDMKNDTWLLADVCYELIDDGDWTIWQSYLVDAKGHEAPWAGADLLEIRFPPTVIDGKPKQHITDFRGGTSNDYKDYYEGVGPDQKTGQRCDAVSYSLPSSFDLSQFTITIDSIMSYPREGEMCSETVMLKIQEVLDAKKTGIKIKLRADQSEGGGICGVEVIQKPENMSQAEAQATVNGNEMFLDLFGIRGPWVFEGSIK